MHDFNTIPLDYSKEDKFRVYKNGHIKLDCNEYSVSPSHVGEHVIVKYYANELVIYDRQYHEITRHKRSFDKGKKYTHWIDFLNLVARRPRALKYVEFYNLLPKEWQDYTALLDKDQLRDALYFLKHCLIEKDFAFATAVAKENMNQHVIEPEALWTTYYRMNENQSLYLPEVSDSDLPPINHTFTIEDYDDLIGGDYP